MIEILTEYANEIGDYVGSIPDYKWDKLELATKVSAGITAYLYGSMRFLNWTRLKSKEKAETIENHLNDIPEEYRGHAREALKDSRRFG